MPRKGYIAKREVAPDPVYSSTLVTKFVNSMMWGGKKSTAQGIFYTAMTNLEQKGGDEALKLFNLRAKNVEELVWKSELVSLITVPEFSQVLGPDGSPLSISVTQDRWPPTAGSTNSTGSFQLLTESRKSSSTRGRPSTLTPMRSPRTPCPTSAR